MVAVGDFWRRGCRGRDGWDFSDTTCWNVTLTGRNLDPLYCRVAGVGVCVGVCVSTLTT